MGLGKRDVEKFVEEHVETFEEALLGTVDLGVPKVETILLALDESNQDELVVALGRVLSQRLSASLILTGGFPDELADEAENYVSERKQTLQREGFDASVLWPTGEESFDKILGTIEEARADLLILPAPYLRDLESLGDESVGTNLDVILARSPIPVLVVRDPEPHPKDILGRVRLAVYDDSPLSKAAAEWAILLSREGRLDALAVVEEEFVEIIDQALALEKMTEQDLAKRLSRELVPLVTAVIRRCAEVQIPCGVEYITGDLVQAILRRGGGKGGMIVLRGYEAYDRPGEKVARDVIPRTRAAVLVVKGPDGGRS